MNMSQSIYPYISIGVYGCSFLLGICLGVKLQTWTDTHTHTHTAKKYIQITIDRDKDHRDTVQFSSVAQLCLTLYDPMNHSMPGLPVHHQLPEFTQTHVHRVSDAIHPSHPLSAPSSPAPNPSQHRVFCNESTLRMRYSRHGQIIFQSFYTSIQCFPHVYKITCTEKWGALIMCYLVAILASQTLMGIFSQTIQLCKGGTLMHVGAKTHFPHFLPVVLAELRLQTKDDFVFGC